MVERTGSGQRMSRRHAGRIISQLATVAAFSLTPLGRAVVGSSFEAASPLLTQAANSPIGQATIKTGLDAARALFTGTPLEMLIPENNFATSPAFWNPPLYTQRDLSANLVVGFGDSNMWGTTEWSPKEPPTTILTYLETLARERYRASWRTLNLSRPGYTTDQVRELEVLAPENIQRVTSTETGIDIIVNAGGNDFRKVMDHPARAHLIQELSRQNFSLETIRNSPLFLEIAQEVYGVLQNFGSSFYELLTSIHDSYGLKQSPYGSPSKLRHMTVITAADFSKVNAVNSAVLEGQVYQYEMRYGWAQAITASISIGMSDQMANAMNRFMAERPYVRLVGINTFDFPREYYEDDQHWNDEGKREIARRYLEKSRIA